MRIKKTASFNVKEGVKSVRYSDLNSGIQYLPADGIINIKSEKVRIAGFGVNESSLYKIDVNGTPYSIGSANSIYLSNTGIITSKSIGGSKGTLSWAMAISDKFGVTVDGTLYAMGGHFAGTIEAKSGKIGTTLINEDGSIVSANGGFRLDANGDLTISHVGGSQLVQDAQTALSTANDAKDKIENAAKFTIYKIDVQYAQNDSNTVAPKAGWSTTAPPWEDGKYMWQQTVTTYGDGRIAVSEPTCISGAEGAPGSSVTLTGYKVQYQAGTSGTTAPTGTWSDTVVSTTTGQFLWTRIQTSFSNGNTYTSYSVSAHGQKGDTGLRGAVGPQGIPGTSVTILSTDVTYQVGGSATVPPSGIWHDDIQQTQTGQYLWTKMVTNFSDGQSITAYSVAAHGATGAQGLRGIQGEKGDQGIPGNDGYSPTVTITKNEGSSVVTITDKNGPHSTTVLDGAKGTPGMKGADGKTSYFHVKYSNDGGKTLTANNGETVGDYIGTRTDFVEMDSTNVADYTWAKIKGETGARGLQGIQGVKGDQGIPGQNGRTSYFHVKYSSVANPTNANQLTETPNTYIGTYVDFTEADSTDPSKYTWTQFKGSQGVKGDQGIAGKNGADGKTSYLHIAYANSADGSSGFDVSNGAGKLYIGQYTDFTQTDSTDHTKYTWSKIKGEQGERGLQGIQGVKGDQGIPGQNGKTSYFHIKYSSVANPTSPSQLTETPSTYIGTYVDFTEADSTDPTRYTWTQFKGSQGAKGDQGIAGKNGADGRTSYLHIAYANSADGSSGFDISNGEGKLYIGQYTDFTQADSTDRTKYTWSKIKGEKGDQGIQGVKGNDGKTTYFHIKYSSVANPSSSSQMTETPDTYIGTYTDFTANDSSDPKAYTWTQFKGSQGAKGDQGIAGKNGIDGKTYYLHIAYANSSDGSSGFSTSDSKGKLYLGQCTDLNQADPTTPASYQWSLIKGDKGLGVKAVVPQYYLSTSNASQGGGSWTETQPAWTSGKYIWTRSKVTWDDNSVTYSSPILANGINSANDKANQAYNLANTANGNASNALNKANSAVNQANAGMNKWLVTEYDSNKSTNDLATIPLLIVNKFTPKFTIEVGSNYGTSTATGYAYSDEYTIIYAITYVKFSADTTVSNIAMFTDDGGTLYVNGKQIIHNPKYAKSNAYSVTFKKGWNVIEVIVQNNASSGGFSLLTKDTSGNYANLDVTKLSNFQRMDCYCPAFSGQTAYGLAVNAKVLETSTSLETVSRQVTSTNTNVTDLMTRTSQVETNVTTLNDNVNNIQVGGRNLAIGTADLILDTRDTDNTSCYQNSDGTFKYQTKKWYSLSSSMNDIKKGDTFTISYDVEIYKCSIFTRLGIEPYIKSVYYSGWTWYTTCDFANNNMTSPFKFHFYNTVVAKTDLENVTQQANIFFQDATFEDGGYCVIKNLKIEKGTKATDWSPAPEDVDASIKGVADTENTHYSTLTTQYNNQQTTINGTITRLGNAENKISTVANDLSNLSIGGRNLYLNTISYRESTPFVLTGTSTDIYIDHFDGKVIYSTTKLTKGTQVVMQAKSNLPWAQVHGGSATNKNRVGMWLYECASLDDAKISKCITPRFQNGDNKSTYMVWKITITQDCYPAFRFNAYSDGTATVTAKVWDIKLELGNKATDWTPAPEDFENKISEQSNAFATYKQTIDGSLSSIGSTYQKKDDMKNYATNSSVQSAINQSKTDITNSVSSNYVKTLNYNTDKQNLETRMSSAEQKITSDAIVSTVKSSHDWSDLQKNASKLDWQIIKTAVDLDTMKTDGRYLLQGAITNGYTGIKGYHYLIVDSVESRVTQKIWYDNNTESGYIRKLKSDGSWTPWVRESNTSNAISVINQSSEGVKIQANRIDINGLVSFNSGSNAITNRIKNDINNIQIGGRNLVIGTADLILDTRDTDNTSCYQNSDGTFRYQTKKWYSLSSSMNDIKKGDTFTISYDVEIYKCSNFTRLGIEPFIKSVYYSGWTYYTTCDFANNNMTSPFKFHFYNTVVAKTDLENVTQQANIFFQDATFEDGGYCVIKNLKIEKGNKATDWSPAPEDVDASVADAKKAGTDAQTAASNAQSTANTAVSNAKTAQDTANDAKNKAENAQSRATTLEQWRTNTVDGRLNHAYNVVNHWAQDASNDSTTINGGLIQTNTITADKIAIGDFTNIFQMNKDNCGKYGFRLDTNSTAGIYHINNVERDHQMGDFISCKGGEQYYISADIYSSCHSNDGTWYPIGVGIHTVDVTYNNPSWVCLYAYPTNDNRNIHIEGTVTSSNNAGLVRAFFQIYDDNHAIANGYTGSDVWISNCEIRKMNAGELIVDGAITTNKLASKSVNASILADDSVDGRILADNAISNSNFKDENYGTSSSWINLKSGKMNLGGKLTWDGSNLGINGNGSFSGNISASTGNIGGWVIESNGIYQRNAFGNVSVTTGVGGIGAIGTSDVDFLRVQKSDGTYPFYVHKDGSMYASNATISGNITATSGKIASFTIRGNYLESSDEEVGMSAGDTSFWAGFNGNDGSYKFKVTKDGYMYASNANISGTITGSIIKSSNSYWDDGNGSLLGRMVYLDNVTYANGGDDGGSNVSRGIGLFGAYGATADVGILGNDKNTTDSNNWYTGLHLDLASTTLRQPASQNCKVMLYRGNVKIKSNTGASIIVYDANNAEKINTIGMYGRVLINDYITFTHPNDKRFHSLSSIQHINNYLEIIVDNRAYGVSAWVSDKTLKRNISSTRINGSSILRNIEFKQFDWIDTGKHENIGVIAQDVEKIDENLVLKIKQCDGTYSYQINPNEFATITAKALQEQMTRIDNIENNASNITCKLENVKNELLLENQKLKARLDYLEAKVKYMNGEKSSYSE